MDPGHAFSCLMHAETPLEVLLEAAAAVSGPGLERVLEKRANTLPVAVRARLAVRMEEETARPDGVEGFWAKELFAHPDLPPPAARSAMVAILRSWETWTARGWGDLASCFTSGTLTHDDQVAWAILGPEGVLEALARAPGPGASTYVYSLFRRARIAGLWEPTTEQVGRLLAELQHPETRAGVLTTFVPAVASPRTGSRLS